MKILQKILLALVILGAFGALFYSWWNWEWIFQKVTIPKDIEKWGAYGDSYNPLSALFGGVALIAAFITILLQIRDNSNDAFESNFFRLLQMWRDTVKEITITREKPNTDWYDITGKAAIQKLWLEFSNSFDNQPIEPHSVSEYKSRYELFYNDHDDILAIYYRSLYYIFRYVNRSTLFDRREYTDIVRAQLSPAELHFLMVNCLVDYGKKFKPFVERFHLLKHIPRELKGVHFNDLAKPFKKSAFAD